ncbi:hypothetical protein AYO46_02545 [Betaproteobacteria bacterium SCGC AG-212-J23]|nr:hypothetical protein AYO46_02545 [Betaproteobacteria bacterium SCGC AG-212-J23]
MTFTREELKRLTLPLLIGLAMLAVGAGVVFSAGEGMRTAQVRLSQAQAERRQNAERLARIAEEEREVNQKMDVYKQLKALNILGEERRLEWADAINRIRVQRELLDVRYRVERQKLVASVPGKPANVDFYASAMRVDLQLLHEQDLLNFLADLRASGNAYYSVKKCVLTRTGQAVGGIAMTPRLSAQCDIDLITVVDRAAKQ